MNVFELAGFTSQDILKHAVGFHHNLNPLIFSHGKMKLDIRKALLKIAEDFLDYLDVDIDTIDITISGSNAAFSYTEYSDIDLHIIAKFDNVTLTELIDTKKTLYNLTHAITVKGISVELYVQEASEKHISLGIYSVLKDEWIQKPSKEKITVNHQDVQRQYKHYAKAIRMALISHDDKIVHDVWDSIKRMRKAGLSANGEFGVENLVFKALRNKHLLSKLKEHMQHLKNRKLSIENRI